MEKQNLTIKISVNTYHQLRSDVGRGNISQFIENLVNRELGGTEKRIEQELAQQLAEQEQRGQLLEKELELAKFHEESGKIKCEC